MLPFLASLCVADPVEVRPLPPGYVYPVLPAAYEGKTLSEYGPIKSIEVIDRKIQPHSKPSPLQNDTIRKLIFEHRLAHPSSFSMLELETDRKLVVTFVDGTRFEYFHSTLQSIASPNKPAIACMLLPEANYRKDRIPVSDKSNKGEQAMPSDGHKPSSFAPTAGSTAPADAH